MMTILAFTFGVVIGGILKSWSISEVEIAKKYLNDFVDKAKTIAEDDKAKVKSEIDSLLG